MSGRIWKACFIRTGIKNCTPDLGVHSYFTQMDFHTLFNISQTYISNSCYDKFSNRKGGLMPK
ncbi:hypothetical protein EMIT074MI3_21022 [Bacillus licheniformis]